MKGCLDSSPESREQISRKMLFYSAGFALFILSNLMLSLFSEQKVSLSDHSHQTFIALVFSGMFLVFGCIWGIAFLLGSEESRRSCSEHKNQKATSYRELFRYQAVCVIAGFFLLALVPTTGTRWFDSVSFGITPQIVPKPSYPIPDFSREMSPAESLPRDTNPRLGQIEAVLRAQLTQMKKLNRNYLSTVTPEKAERAVIPTREMEKP